MHGARQGEDELNTPARDRLQVSVSRLVSEWIFIRFGTAVILVHLVFREGSPKRDREIVHLMCGGLLCISDGTQA